MLAVEQLCHLSVTAPSHATHAADAVTDHRCYELWSHTVVADERPKCVNGLLSEGISVPFLCLQCFNAVGWEEHPVRKNLSDVVLAWLFSGAKCK